MIGTYPDFHEIELADQPLLDPLFRRLREGVSELTFAGLFCFRATHAYRLSRLPDGTIVLAGSDKGDSRGERRALLDADHRGRVWEPSQGSHQKCFFVCPFALPPRDLLDALFERCTCLKLATEAQAGWLRGAGYEVSEDRDNFDYLYHREDLASLAGRALQKKRNLVHAFERAHLQETLPLTRERIGDALAVLEAWREHARDLADYVPARDALVHGVEFGLEGRITYVADEPAGYALGEPAANGTMFIVHYEKTVPDTKGLYQFINMDFARALPAQFSLINREQDLGDPGLRQAKMTYRPCAFVKKYRARKPGPA